MGLLMSTVVLGACSGGSSANKSPNLTLNYLNFSKQTQAQIKEDFSGLTLAGPTPTSSSSLTNNATESSDSLRLDQIDLSKYPTISVKAFEEKYKEQVKDPALVVGKSSIELNFQEIVSAKGHECHFEQGIVNQTIYLDEKYVNVFKLVVEEELVEGDSEVCDEFSELGQRSLELNTVAHINAANEEADSFFENVLIFKITEDSYAFVGFVEAYTVQIYFHVGETSIEIREAVVVDDKGMLIEHVEGAILGDYELDPKDYDGYQINVYKQSYDKSQGYFPSSYSKVFDFDFEAASSGELNYSTF